MTEDEVIEVLREAVQSAGTQYAWAYKNGISTSYLSDVLHRRREPGKAILQALGLQRVVRYEAKGERDGSR